MSEEKKKVDLSDSIWVGQITDSKGRVIKLRSPTIIDEYSLCRIMGKDAEQSQCLMMGEMLLKVAAIDNVVMATPATYNQFMANLTLLGHEGFAALLDHAKKEIMGGEGEKEAIKK